MSISVTIHYILIFLETNTDIFYEEGSAFFSLKCLRVEMSQQKVDKFLIYENDFQRFQCHGIILVHKRNVVYNMENQVPYNELIAPQPLLEKTLHIPCIYTSSFKKKIFSNCLLFRSVNRSA